MIFYLGTHEPHWLGRLDVPLFISHRRLARFHGALPRARGPWALDSGGFTELSLYGAWRTTEADYARAAARYAVEIGGLVWAAPQDWMCEAHVLKKTGLDIPTHQARTITSVLSLRAQERRVHWIPVLQGFSEHDYIAHAESYARAGLDLRTEALVGVGSICRRSGTVEAEQIMRALTRLGLRLHAFGAKVTGLARYADVLSSSDSLAWSFRARRAGHALVDGCTHRTCTNCARWALAWRTRVLRDVHGRLAR